MTDGPPPRHLHPVEPPPDDGQPYGRQPPQDLAAEQSCLGAMLINTDAITQVTAVLYPSDYYRPSHEQIHDAIVALHHRGDPVDMVTVGAELERRGELQRIGGAPYLHTLASGVPIAANASYYAAIVRDKARLRTLVDDGTKLTNLGYAGDIDKAEKFLGDAVDHITETAMRFGTTSGTTSTGLHDLSWILTGQAPTAAPPVYCVRTDGHALFYSGKVNGIFGDPECGKTWVAQTAGVQALNAGGTFAMIDVDHNGADHTAARMLLLGAHIDDLANPEKFRYYEPEDADQLRAAVTDITTRAPDVVVIDSLGEVLPMLNVKSVDNDEITDALRLVCTPIAVAGSCVITIDHLPKSAEARVTGYAIGGTAKKRIMRGSYIRAEARTQPAPGQIGRITLRIEKDTTGELRKVTPGGYAGTFVLDSTQPHVTTYEITREDMPTNPDGSFRPTGLMERVSRFIEDNDQCTFTDIKEAITAKDKWLRDAIQVLVVDGFVARIDGARRAKLHHSIAPYRETEDDRA